MPGQGIRPSTIRAAGLGLFATKDHGKDDLVALYTGRQVEIEQDVDYEYGLSHAHGIVIDASDALRTERGRFANHRDNANAALHTLTTRQRVRWKLRKFNLWPPPLPPPFSIHFPAVLVYAAADACLGVVALRTIKKDSEVFVDYGPSYFKNPQERASYHVLEQLGKMLTSSGELLFTDEEIKSPALRKLVVDKLKANYAKARPVIDYMYFGPAIKNALRDQQ